MGPAAHGAWDNKAGRWTLLRLLPFLVLGFWAFLVLRSAQASGRRLDECSAWSLGIHRYQEAFSALHARASGLLLAESIPLESPRVEAAIPALHNERAALSRRAARHADPGIEAVEVATASYLDQWGSLRRKAESADPQDQAQARLELARLDHRHQEVLGALEALEILHRERLEAAIRNIRKSTDQMMFFSFGALFIALGFGTAWGIAARAKRKSKRQERLLKTLVDGVPEALLGWDSSGVMRWVNEGWWKMTGLPPRSLSPEETIGALLPQGVPERLEAHPGERIDFNLFHADGRMLAVHGVLAATPYGPGRLNLAILQDISQETLVERKLKEDERMSALGHELVEKTRDLGHVLNPMLLALDMLRRKARSQDLEDPVWRQLDQEAMAAARLISDLSGYSLREGQNHPEVFDMATCVHEVTEGFLLEGHPFHGFRLDLAADPALAHGSRRTFRDGVRLLVQRALDASPHGVPVSIRTRVEDGRFHLQVEDEGRAIPEEHLSWVFDPAFLAFSRPGRSSLGLFNVAEAIKTMGGEANVEITPEGVTRFHIAVPISA